MEFYRTSFVFIFLILPSFYNTQQIRRPFRRRRLTGSNQFSPNGVSFARNGGSNVFGSPSSFFSSASARSGSSNLFDQPFFSNSNSFGSSFSSDNPFSSFSFKPSFSFSPAPAASTSDAFSNSFSAPSSSFNTAFNNFGSNFQPFGDLTKRFNSKQLPTSNGFGQSNPFQLQSPSTVFTLAPSNPSSFFQNFPAAPVSAPAPVIGTIASNNPSFNFPQSPSFNFPAPTPSFSFPAQSWDSSFGLTGTSNLQDQLNNIFQQSGLSNNLPSNFVQDKFNEAWKKSTTQFGTFSTPGASPMSFPSLPFGSTGSMSNMFSQTKPDSLDMAKNAFTLEDFSKSLSKQLNFNKSTATVALPLVSVSPIVANPPAPARPPARRVTTTTTDTPDEPEETEAPLGAPQFQIVTTTTPQFVIVKKTTTTTASPPATKQPDCVVQEQPIIPLKDFLNPAVQPACARNKYRAHTGECNNIAFPSRGKESTVFIRLLAPDYADGIAEPRKNSRNQALPSARLISSSLIGSTQHLAPTWTNMFMQFGQFLDHDLTSTPRAQLSSDAPQCCGAANPHPQCFSIQVPNNDPFFSQFGQTCMEFVRSLPGIRPGCRLGPREQINQLSAFIDGSQIYGIKDGTVSSLRSFSGGQLKSVTPFRNNPGYTVLPADPSNSACVDAANGRPCFKAGDDRCNVQLGLETMHTVFMRHHNQMATNLQQVNPQWDDETVYQETRAIMAAQLQHITYNEWLPLLLGDDMMDRVGLRLLQSGRFGGYNISIHPGLINSFATAAFRVGHAMVPSKFNRLNPDFSLRKAERVQDTYFKSSFLYEQNAVDEMVRGLTTQQGKVIEGTVTTDLSQQLFSTSPGTSFGLDLVAMNIQRGRDHGLPGWMKFRRLCGLTTATNFNDLRNLKVLPDDFLNRLATAYQSVDDIDLYVAGIAENHNGEAFIGPTFSCIISEQFWRLRVADRFWYEGSLPFSHTLIDAQLAEIRKISLSRVLCNAVPGIQAVQPNVFQTISTSNPRVSCDGIQDFSLQPWAQS